MKKNVLIIYSAVVFGVSGCLLFFLLFTYALLPSNVSFWSELSFFAPVILGIFSLMAFLGFLLLIRTLSLEAVKPARNTAIAALLIVLIIVIAALAMSVSGLKRYSYYLNRCMQWEEVAKNDIGKTACVFVRVLMLTNDGVNHYSVMFSSEPTAPRVEWDHFNIDQKAIAIGEFWAFVGELSSRAEEGNRFPSLSISESDFYRQLDDTECR